MKKYGDRCDLWKDQDLLFMFYLYSTPIFTDTLVFSCSERINEGLVVEVTFSYSSYKVPKFNANFLTLSSSAAGPYFPREKTGEKPVIIIGARNRADSPNQALRIAGRFGREIWLSMADKVRREKHYPNIHHDIYRSSSQG